MAELKPLGEIPKKEPEKNQEVKQPEKQPEKVEISNDLLKKVNGELCFELEFGSKKLVISESKCSQLIPEFKKMLPEQKETFLMQRQFLGRIRFQCHPKFTQSHFRRAE